MNLLRLMGVLSIPIIFLACTPRVYTQSTPAGLRATGGIIKYGEPETTLVSLSIKRQEGGPSWTAEFTDGTKADIVAEDIPGLTIFKWKIEKDRVKTLTKQPFNLTVKNVNSSYGVTVTFAYDKPSFGGQLLGQVLVRVIVAR